MNEKTIRPIILTWPEAEAPDRLPKHVYTLPGPALSKGDWPNSLSKCDSRHVLKAAEILNKQVNRLCDDYGCLPNQVLCVPGSEWGVLPTGLANSNRKSDGVDLDIAVASTDRRTQRERLEPTGLNPKWAIDNAEGLPGFPMVIKAALSTESAGVAMAWDWPDINNAVQQVNKKTAFMKMRLSMVKQVNYSYLIEEYIDGKHFEVSGVVDNQNAIYFRPLHVTCDDDDKKVVAFAPMTKTSHKQACDLAANVVRTLGLRWCFFLLEFKRREGQPYVIEAQCRLGAAPQHPEYFGLISPSACPIERGMEFLFERWNS